MADVAIHPDLGARLDLVRRARMLQCVTIGWNSGECLVALVAGGVAGSIALVGFGLDSAIEVTSSVAALWRLARERDQVCREAAERRAMRVIGACFLLLAVYVLQDAVTALASRTAPEHSTVGIVLTALSLVVMPVLVHQKRRVAARLGSGALEAEARQTRACAYLSAIVLGGLALNSWLGWWWADPVAGLVMVPLIAWEGVEAVRGRTCCGAP